MRRILLLAACVVGLPGLVRAQDAAAPLSFSASVRTGTLGVGPEAEFRFNNTPFGVRVGFNTYNLGINDVFRRSFRSAGAGYSYSTQASFGGNLELLNGGVTEDYHPFRNGFRLSIGEYINGNQLVARAQSSGTLVMDGATYNTGQIGEVTGRAVVNTVAPYLGFGYSGEIWRGLTLSADAGVLYQGSPRVSVAATGPINDVPQFRADLARQRARIQHDLDYPFYPVLQVGLGYRF